VLGRHQLNLRRLHLPAEGRREVALSHDKLTDAEAAARIRAYWRDRLAALK
jgi:hypothetical protein